MDKRCVEGTGAVRQVSATEVAPYIVEAGAGSKSAEGGAFPAGLLLGDRSGRICH